jgi:hypothetical protein
VKSFVTKLVALLRRNSSLLKEMARAIKATRDQRLHRLFPAQPGSVAASALRE